MTSPSKSAIILLSGGLDSATCLAWALTRYARVETIGFDYGQRHAIELAVRAPLLQHMRKLSPDWNSRLGDDHLIDLSVIGKISDTALTSDVAIAHNTTALLGSLLLTPAPILPGSRCGGPPPSRCRRGRASPRACRACPR